MDASRGQCLWRDRRHAGALLGRRLAPHVHHHQDTTVVGLPRGGLEVAAELASVLQLPLSCWSVQRLTLPGQEGEPLGAIAPGNIHILDEARLRQLGLHGEEQRQWLRLHEERMRQEQLRFGDPAPGELSHRRLILVDEGIRSGMTMAAALRSLRALYPTTITVAVPVGRRLALDGLRQLADHVLALQAVEQLPRLTDWFAALPALEEGEVIALLGAA
ncbi:MAG: phosphoribosyltransferase [Cyanobium sp.]